MTERKTLPYGSWPSPISVEMAVGAAHGLSELRLDGEDLYFLESRTEEAGRVVLMRRTSDGTTADVVPTDLNVRTRVHEYGGGAYAVQDGTIVFSEFASNRLMLKRDPAAGAEALTTDAALRFADMEIDGARDRAISVLEDHREPDGEPRNLLCAVSFADGSLAELATGHDFYSAPRLDPSGQRLAWLTWDHPRMPWDGTDLWVADIDADGVLSEPVHVAGGPAESVLQPTWAPDGSLVYASDSTGWWNLFRWRAGASGPTELAPMEAEFASPPWAFGQRAFDIAADGSIVAAVVRDGVDKLFVLADGERPRKVPVEPIDLSDLQVQDGTLTFVGGSPTRPTAIIRLDLASGRAERLRESGTLAIDPRYLSTPRHLDYPTSGGDTAHTWYYPPTNPDFEASPGETPPLVVMTHGGPTSRARTSLSLARQAFTSRGFAVADVDYRGSSGYGRTFRDALDGRWGVADVEDCSDVATWLAEQGLADVDRLLIRGGSAGGFTTLAALAFTKVFAAGASFYGVGDLEALTRFTHKFESRYLDGLVGPYPQETELYRERSPIYHVDQISCPVLVLQGTDDRVVPQAQADDIVAALERNGLPRAYLLFEGEGHGFRKAESQRRALEAELSFYAQVFGFELADTFDPIEVVGLST